MPLQAQAAAFLILLPASEPGKAADGPGAWAQMKLLYLSLFRWNFSLPLFGSCVITPLPIHTGFLIETYYSLLLFYLFPSKMGPKSCKDLPCLLAYYENVRRNKVNHLEIISNTPSLTFPVYTCPSLEKTLLPALAQYNLQFSILTSKFHYCNYSNWTNIL